VNIPQDAIVFLNANRNSQRKRLDLTIQGFVGALAKNPKLHLMMVTNMNPQTGAYYDIQRIYAEELKLAGLEPYTYIRNLILMDTSPPNIIDDDGINQLYNLADFGINTSDGEGYGLCQLEHMQTGAPQVVTGLSSYSAFLDESVAAMVPASGRSYFAGGMPHGLWYPTFTPEKVTAAIEHAVANAESMRSAIRARTFKTWSAICDEFLEDLLMQVSGQASSVSVPVTSASPSS
jgi:glycosyltransferase involved in cell wall biosynthesis